MSGFLEKSFFVATVILFFVHTPVRALPRSGELSGWNYVGNIQSMKFHLASCEFASLMSRSKRIPFQFRQQALDAGMKPCNWCMPAWNLKVTGHLLRQSGSDTTGGADTAARQ